MKDVKIYINDLELKDGDLIAIRGDEQTVDMLAQTEQGEWKMSAEDGLGVRRYAGAPAVELQKLKAMTIEGLIRNKIEGDVAVENNQLIIDVK